MSTASHRVFAIALAASCAVAACSGDATGGATSSPQSAAADNHAARTPDVSRHLAETPRLQAGFSQCAGFDSWPDAADCLRTMADEESSRLDRAFAALAGSVDAKSRELLGESQSAWKQLTEADRAIEASIYDPLGPAGYFEAASNDVLRLCARAEQLQGWLALTGAKPPAPSSETEAGARASNGNCMPLPPECIRDTGSPDRRLDGAYADLAERLTGESGELLAQSRNAWANLKAKELSFERSSSLSLPEFGRNIRVCERISLLEGYQFFINQE